MIEVMISIGIMSISMAAVGSLLSYQFRENKALSEKLAALDTERSIIAALADPDKCSNIFVPANLVNPSSLTFDSGPISPTHPYSFNLTAIPDASIEAGKPPSPLSKTLVVRESNNSMPGISVTITSIHPVKAQLFVRFQDEQLSRPLKSLAFPLHISLSGPPNASQIQGCASRNVMTGVIKPFPSYNTAIVNTYKCPKGTVSDCYAITTAGTTTCILPVETNDDTCTINPGCATSDPSDPIFHVILRCSWIE